MPDIVSLVLQAINSAALVQVEVSARHVHLTSKDVETLFGKGAGLTLAKQLSQPGEFLSEERVALIGSKGRLDNIAILGPARSNTQIELSKSDAIALGVLAPLRESGDLVGSAQVTLEGPKGNITPSEGAIVAKRHIHVPLDVAKIHGFRDKERVSVQLYTDRPVILQDVVLRVSNKFRYKMHIDFDEANAAGVSGFTLGRILR